jgi:hypothetical protein
MRIVIQDTDCPNWIVPQAKNDHAGNRFASILNTTYLYALEEGSLGSGYESTLPTADRLRTGDRHLVGDIGDQQFLGERKIDVEPRMVASDRDQRWSVLAQALIQLSTHGGPDETGD